MPTLKSSLKHREERQSTVLDHLGGDDDSSSPGGDDLENSGDDMSIGSSSRSSSNAPRGFLKRMKSSVTKRLHLELFGITWFDFAAMSCARWMFLFALLAAAAGLAVAVYIGLRDNEHETFGNEVRKCVKHELADSARIKSGICSLRCNTHGDS